MRRERRVRWCWREGGGAPCTGRGRDGGEGWREVEVGGAMHEIEKREHTVHID